MIEQRLCGRVKWPTSRMQRDICRGGPRITEANGRNLRRSLTPPRSRFGHYPNPDPCAGHPTDSIQAAEANPYFKPRSQAGSLCLDMVLQRSVRQADKPIADDVGEVHLRAFIDFMTFRLTQALPSNAGERRHVTDGLCALGSSTGRWPNHVSLRRVRSAGLATRSATPICARGRSCRVSSPGKRAARPCPAYPP